MALMGLRPHKKFAKKAAKAHQRGDRTFRVGNVPWVVTSRGTTKIVDAVEGQGWKLEHASPGMDHGFTNYLFRRVEDTEAVNRLGLQRKDES